MNLLDILVALACLGLGFASRTSLLRLYVYALPYIAGNVLVSFVFPVNVGRIAGGAIIFFGIVGLPHAPVLAKRLRNPILAQMALTLIITAIGLAYVLLYAGDQIDLWVQSPLERAARSTFREAYFWLVPLGFAVIIRNLSQCRILVRDFLVAGILYSTLGLIQFAVGLIRGVDIFPIIRGSVENLQVMVGVGVEGTGRITSICGEPRYFSGFLTLWFIIALMCGSWIGLRRWQIRALCMFFLAVNLLTASRTGMGQLALILLFVVIIAMVSRSRPIRRQALEMTVFGVMTFIAISTIDGLVLSSRIGERNAGEGITIAGFTLPIEFQDSEAIRLLGDKPVALLTGFGSGLWQYSADAELFAGFRSGTFGEGGAGLDSLRQNISALGVITNFGLCGVLLVCGIYLSCFRFLRGYPGSTAIARNISPAILVLIATTFTGNSDQYCNVIVMMGFIFWQHSVIERANPVVRQTPLHTKADMHDVQALLRPA